ncbi:MAG: GH3 auxin-responsive promoter family protein [Eubacterium sp.]|nr:GH3 auxin-responsive promoter family protein [Eubacterium sp.]
MKTPGELLRQILDENKNTEYGRLYNFSEIYNINEYKKRVPLTTYDDYEAYVDRMREGEKEVLTSYEVMTYCTTSGTSKNRVKYIPQTRKQYEVYGEHLDAFPDRFMEEHGGKRLYQQTFRTEPGGADPEMLVSEQWYKYKAETGRMDFDSYVGGKALLFDREKCDPIFARCYAALLERDLRIIEAVFLYDEYHFFTYLEHYYDRLLHAMKTHVIPEKLVPSETMREAVLFLPIPEGRVDEIEKAAEGGFEGIAHRLWPGLSLLVGASNRSFFAESEGLDYYTKGIPRYYNMYTMSEMFVANCIGEDDFRYRIFMDHGFFEFLPCEKEDGEDTLTAEECEIGGEYELIVTSYNGFYRYRTGDVLRVVSRQEGDPVVEFVRRRGMALNIAGEKVSMVQLEESIRRLREDGIAIAQFCFAPSLDREAACYHVALAVSEEPPFDDAGIADRLDTHLREINSGYAWIREMSYLDHPVVKTLAPERYFQFLSKNGMMDGNNKPKHTAPTGFREW